MPPLPGNWRAIRVNSNRIFCYGIQEKSHAIRARLQFSKASHGSSSKHPNDQQRTMVRKDTGRQVDILQSAMKCVIKESLQCKSSYYSPRSISDCRYCPLNVTEHLRGTCCLSQSHRSSDISRVAIHGDGKCYHGDGQKRRGSAGCSWEDSSNVFSIASLAVEGRWFNLHFKRFFLMKQLFRSSSLAWKMILLLEYVVTPTLIQSRQSLITCWILLHSLDVRQSK